MVSCQYPREINIILKGVDLMVDLQIPAIYTNSTASGFVKQTCMEISR